MQRTVRTLKIALPVTFVVFVLILVLSWDRTAGRSGRAAAESVTSTLRPEDTPQIEGRAFRDVQTIGGRVVSEIVAERVVSFESGWTTLEGVKLTLYRENGLTYVVLCPEAQFNSKTKEAEAKGGVRVQSSDGIEIATAEIRYDGARLANDIPVEFRIDRWNGRAGALELNVRDEKLRLHKNVSASMEEAGQEPMSVQSVESIFHRRENTVEFQNQVALHRGIEHLKSDWMLARFTQDRRQIIGLEGRGNASVVMAAAPGIEGAAGKGITEVTCETFATELGHDGRIAAINANGGSTAAHAHLAGPPARDIDARSFRVALSGQNVSEIKADGQVVMIEKADVERTIQAERVTVWFDAATRKARSAYLEGNFRYRDPKTTASAFRANYDITGDRVVLTTDPGWQATVVSEGNVLKAKQIEFSPRAQNARASGSVIAQLASKPKSNAAAADSTNLFPSGKPVFVNSDELIMRQSNRIAHFAGRVKAWQESNSLFADELQVQGNGELITARGNVKTLLHNTSEAERRKTPLQATTNQLMARRGEQKIEMTGNVAIRDESRTLDAEKATFFFDQARKLDRVEVDGNVALAEGVSGRKGNGERAVYQAQKEVIHMFGSPAKISDPAGWVSGQQIVFDLARDRVQVVSDEGKTTGTYKHDG
jgi:lipopolysaccharide transport protein LptA